MNRFKKFISYYKPYMRTLIADLLCAFAVSGVTLAIPLCTRNITKTLSDGTADLHSVLGMGGLMLALIALHTICIRFIDYNGHAMGAMMERDMRAELFNHYLELPFGFFDRQRTGQLMSRITNDILSLTELYHHGPEDIAIAVLKFTGAFVILININVELTITAFALLPVMAVFSIYYNKKMNGALRSSRDKTGDLNARVEQTLSGIRTVKSFTNEAFESERFCLENDEFCDTRKYVYKNESTFSVGMISFTQLITLSVIVFGSIAIFNRAIDIADLLTFLLYMGILIEPIGLFTNFARLYQEGITGFDRFMEMIEVKPDIIDSETAIVPSAIRGDIEFRNVAFKYKDDYAHVLKGVSFKINAGEYVALIGSSGVGKTTLCSLIPRFYDVSEGMVLLDNIDVRNISIDSLRGSVGVVQQDMYMFAGSVADNIRYGKPTATIEEIIEAAKSANAHEFISQLPDGYDTDIGQRGVLLSGGQKQRISIARIFLKNPPVIILDEATSALDNETESMVQESLDMLARTRTTIVIAHRLSTIKNAKRVFVLSEQGIHEERNS